MSKTISLLLLFFSGPASAQLNYLFNPGFEQHSFCPTAGDQVYASEKWHSIDTTETFGNAGHPDYDNTCAEGSYSIAAIPTNSHFFQYPHSGEGLMTVQTFDDELEPANPFTNWKRDYLQGRLYKKLSTGQSYCVTFYVNLTEASSYAIKEVGAYLDNGTIDTTKNWGLPQTKYIPQVTNTGGFLTDTAAWVKIEGSFIANGKEQFITIGNFKDKAHTSYMPLPINAYNNGSNYTWYLIDDVSVIESTTRADAGPDTHCGQGDSVYIGRPREVGLECTWAKLGSSAIIGAGAGIWVKPTVATSYVVTQTLCGVITKDTVKVDVWKLGVGSSSVNGQTQQYGISPNPNNGVFRIGQAVAQDEVADVAVYNVVGQQVYSGKVAFRDGSAAVELNRIPAGIYYMHLRDAAGDAYELRMIRE